MLDFYISRNLNREGLVEWPLLKWMNSTWIKEKQNICKQTKLISEQGSFLKKRRKENAKMCVVL